MSRRTTIRAVATLSAAIALLVASHSWAQATRDHLQCFKIKDPQARAAYNADLLPDNAVFPRLEPGCTIRTPARQLCIDVAKTNVSPQPPGDVSGRQGQVYLCYRAVCNKLATELEVSDQFGDRALQIRSTTMVCTPVAGPCANGVKDEDETDVDCGGSCSGCAGGADCKVNSDCASGTCGPDRRCTTVCAAGFADCDGIADNGCEADLSSDPNNCGACGISVWSGNQCLIDACADGQPQWSPAPAGTSCDQNGGNSCDGYGNCVSGCTGDQFACESGDCIDAALQCNGNSDCPDGSDEAPYNPACGGGCMPGQFACESDGTCIDAAAECNGYPDCPDGSDESPYDPACNGMCWPNAFVCADGVCIPGVWQCDGIVDCADGSDESPINPVCGGGCTPEQFTCADGTCIKSTWQCDGYMDCPDGSDEAPINPVCGGGCTPEQFTCADGTCIKSTWQCDGYMDCPDGSDEAPINPVCGGGCTPDQFTCADGTCINAAWQCDGIVDCADGSDEAPINPVCGGGCTPDMFDCGDGSCIDVALQCNGYPDCANAADEAPVNPVCPAPNCPAGGFAVAGICWYRGDPGESCNSACPPGMTYDTATDTYAGSSGTDQNCANVLDGLGAPAGAVMSVQTGVGAGCALALVNSEVVRLRDLTPTTPDAADPQMLRLCACKLSPP